METDGSVLCSQGTAAGHYAEPDTSNLRLSTLFLGDPF